MGSPVTFSGFNNIDFNMILDSVMKQARAPLTALEGRQSAFKQQLTALGKFTSQAAALKDAASALAKSTAGDAVAASTTDATAITVSAGTNAIAGRYDVIVQELARAQVTTSATTLPDATTTIAATGGSLTIGDTTVTLTGSVTLQQLATAINGTTDIGVRASVVQSSAGAFRLVLTGTTTGEAESFAITNDLAGSPLTFGGNAVEATDASILVNNVAVVSSTNVFDAAIPGMSLTVLKKDPATTVGVNVTADSGALKARLDTFVKAYNDLTVFLSEQRALDAKGDGTSIARDPMLRQIKNQLRSVMTAAYGTSSPDRLTQVGLEFTLAGTVKLDPKKFSEAFTSNPTGLQDLLSGSSGAFAAITGLIGTYTRTDGLLDTGKKRLTSQIRSMDGQLFQAESRLAVQRQTLQKEYLAAEIAMSRLNSQSSALSGIGG